MTSTSVIRKKYKRISSRLDEKTRRLWCASEALTIKKGGVAIVHAATGISRPTIYAGIKELERKQPGPKRKRVHHKKSDRDVRKKGGGSKTISYKTPGIVPTLEALIEPEAKGYPENPLRWTSKSSRKLAVELKNQNFTVSHSTVALLLKKTAIVYN